MLRQIQPIGPLRDPVVIASFVQGNGINSTAAATLAYLVRRHGAEAVAEFEPHQYFDFSVRRPMVRVERGRRVIDWPQNRIHLLKGKDTGRDALVLSGIEPHLRWREFSESIAGLVPRGATVIIVRSLPGAVPHTRPVVLRLTTSNEPVARQLGLRALRPEYQGPVDVGEVILAQLARSGCATAGLTAVVPTYLGVVPNPMAVVALTERLDDLLGLSTPLEEFRSAWDKVRAQADRQMEESAEVRDAVRAMEEQYESIASGTQASEQVEPGASEDPPSAEGLLGDIERFLSEEAGDT